MAWRRLLVLVAVALVAALGLLVGGAGATAACAMEFVGGGCGGPVMVDMTHVVVVTTD